MKSVNIKIIDLRLKESYFFKLKYSPETVRDRSSGDDGHAVRRSTTDEVDKRRNGASERHVVVLSDRSRTQRVHSFRSNEIE